MYTSSVTQKILLGLLVTLLFCLFIPQTALGQTEKLGAVSYASIKGWTKTAKENIVTFSQVDEAAGRFCFISLYGATPGTGDPKNDFKREWNNLVVKPFQAEPAPKTETEIADGWTMLAGGSAIEFQGSKAIAFLTVMSSGMRTVSILGIFNHESYTAQLSAFGGSIDVGKDPAAIYPAVPPVRESQANPPSSASMNNGLLVREFENNEVAATQAYMGKRLRVSGTINYIKIVEDGRILLSFKSTLGAYGNARCYFSQSQSSAVAALKAHTEATVEGTVRGWEGGFGGAKVFVFLDDCVVP